MRENKFRVWCVNKREWETDECFLATDGYLYHSSKYGLITPLKATTHIVSCYTGFKDKNGKEIYEGDIVEEITTLNYAPHIQTRIKGKTIVKYDIARLRFNITPHKCRTFEVIGNIYENPDLLEVKK